MNYPKMLEKILSKQEFAGSSPELYHDDNTLLRHLLNMNIIGQFDWKHLNDVSLYNFIDERMCAIDSKGLEPIGLMPTSASNYYMELYPSGRVNYASFVLRYYDRMMKNVGLRLLHINLEDDSYNIVVVKSANVSKLKRIKTDFWKYLEIK